MKRGPGGQSGLRREISGLSSLRAARKEESEAGNLEATSMRDLRMEERWKPSQANPRAERQRQRAKAGLEGEVARTTLWKATIIMPERVCGNGRAKEGARIASNTLKP